MRQSSRETTASRLFQLAPALLGVLGVLIGAAVAGGVTYLVDESHAKADERGAERLVLAEVMSDEAVLRNPDRLADAAWRAERERLARSLSNSEWAWVAKYYIDVARAKTRGSSPNGTDRLKADAPCTLAALNVWDYSRSRYYKELRKNRSCKSPPNAVS